LKLAEMTVRLVGPKHPELAMEIMGWVVSIPVFCDSGFVILNPIRKALQRKTRYSSVAMTVALSAGLYAAHVFIPPTPGPIAAAGALGLESHLLGVIGWGAVVSIPALIAAFFFANWIGKKVRSSEDLAENEEGPTYEELLKSFKNLPNGFLSLAPILIPIICMAAGSIASMAGLTGTGGIFLKFIGTPIMALTAGVIFAVILLFTAGKTNGFYEMTNETLKVVGPILFITAAGSVLGKVIVAAGFVDYMKGNAAVLSTLGIFFPFILAAILKSAQGSSTVAITTTAGIMGSIAESGSMMTLLGLTSPLAGILTVLAIGAGAMTVSHANDSYFWVVTNFGELTPQDGYKTQTMVTLIMGVVSILFIWLLSLFLI
jgi:GntP family gluconate:H+ symporter